MKHLLMNVVEYFKKEVKKSKGHPNFSKEYQKQPVRQCVVFKLIVNYFFIKVFHNKISGKFVMSFRNVVEISILH